MIALRAPDLEARICLCGQPTTTSHPMAFVPMCHPKSAVRAAYADGQVSMVCDTCNKFVTTIAVEGFDEMVTAATAATAETAASQKPGTVWVTACQSCGADGCGEAKVCPYSKARGDAPPQLCKCCDPCRSQCSEDATT